MNGNWMDNIKNLMDGYEKEAPEGLLDDIKKEMARRGIMASPQQKRRSSVLFRYAAAIAAIMVVSYIAIFHGTDRTQKADVSPTDKTELPLQQAETQQEKVESKHTPIIIIEKLVARATEQIKKEMATFDTADTTALIAQNTEQEPAPENTAQETPQHTSNAPTLKHSATPHYGVQKVKHKSHNKTWSIGAYCGGITNGIIGMADQGDCAMPDNYSMDDAIDFATGTYMDSYEKNAPGASSSDVEEEHYPTIRAGLSVRYNINNRWNLQTGITYSRLNSDFTEKYGMTTRQTLQYIGVPVNVGYNIWTNSHFNIYAIAGGEIQKLISGSAKTLETTEKVNESRPILSTNIAAGIEYMATPAVSIYAEPGATCHFKNGSGVKSAYTDQPVNFQLNLGIRINVNK